MPESFAGVGAWLLWTKLTRSVNHWPCEPGPEETRSAVALPVPNSPRKTGAVVYGVAPVLLHGYEA